MANGGRGKRVIVYYFVTCLLCPSQHCSYTDHSVEELRSHRDTERRGTVTLATRSSKAEFVVARRGIFIKVQNHFGRTGAPILKMEISLIADRGSFPFF